MIFVFWVCAVSFNTATSSFSHFPANDVMSFMWCVCTPCDAIIFWSIGVSQNVLTYADILRCFPIAEDGYSGTYLQRLYSGSRGKSIVTRFKPGLLSELLVRHRWWETNSTKQNETKLQNVFHQENKRQTMLVRVWEKVDPSSLLVELETGMAVMETDSAFSQNTKNGTVT